MKGKHDVVVARWNLDAAKQNIGVKDRLLMPVDANLPARIKKVVQHDNAWLRCVDIDLDRIVGVFNDCDMRWVACFAQGAARRLPEPLRFAARLAIWTRSWLAPTT